MLLLILLALGHPPKLATNPYYEPTKCIGSRCSFPAFTRPIPGTHTREPGMMYFGPKCCYG